MDATAACYVGGVRGVDEVGHDVFSLQIGGATRFGEIGRRFGPDATTYDLVVGSFGYHNRAGIGEPARPASMTAVEAEAARHAVLRWVEALNRLPPDERQPFLFLGRFSGSIVFDENWTRITDGTGRPA